MLRTLLITLVALTTSLSALAAKDRETIKLKDGTMLVIQDDGKMRHVDPRGSVVRMKEGEVMEAEDGTRYMMKNNAIWKRLYEKGTLNPKQ